MPGFLISTLEEPHKTYRCERCQAVLVPAPEISGLAYFGHNMFLCQQCGEKRIISSHGGK
jgi:predicted RNA-binding Zn-ribbon protein involved in translation (DUF1610 family)